VSQAIAAATRWFCFLLNRFDSNMSFGASQCMPLNDLKADFLDEESSLTLELRDFTV
jgi:hypothetical protein